MKRIFLTLAIVSTLLLWTSAGLGFGIKNSRSPALSYHLLTSVAALIFAALVHAVLLTYFMGTGRWMEEVGAAYQLDPKWNDENRRLKYRTIPLMVGCVILLILNIPFGALARGEIHLAFALVTIAVNFGVNVVEYRAIRRNGELIAEIVREVRVIREARGLPM